MNRPSVSSHLPATHAGSVWRWIKWSFVVVILAAIAIVVRIVQIEIDTLRLQARYLSELTRDIGFAVEPGRATVPLSRDEWSLRRAARLCGAPCVHRAARKARFAIAAQARDSARMISLADDGLFLPYEEKDQTGIVLRDANGATLFHTRYPQRAYESFEAVPPLVRDSLLFIEDKYLLAADQPNRNPAIDWGRFFPCARQPGRARLNISARLQRVGYSPAKFHLRMTRDEMGSYLGLQLETVSRSFSKFQKASLIELRGKQINIVDRGGLERI